MIWYLLYPFRGTTEPPSLSQEHPIRKAFFRYGTATARHWLFSILLSVCIGVLLCYPVFFLYENPTTGASTLPHHVWTSARPFDGNKGTVPDVEMRQIWVHGSYMRALEREVLAEALKIQSALIPPSACVNASRYSKRLVRLAEEHEVDSLSIARPSGTNLVWGFHSPLMFWNCSQDALLTDPNVLNTINNLTNTHTHFNFTLRPTSVFAGKEFHRRRLQAADALVITLFDRPGYYVEQEWDARLSALAKDNTDRWSFYPATGVAARSQLYQFSFQIASLMDDLWLGLLYVSTLGYLYFSLRKLRAVKSKWGLIFTGLVQMGTSVTASFTICALLGINLSQIPREAYPFVVLIIGTENMFRLINAVLVIPAEMPTTARLANALGDVGHLSLAAAGQNLILLYLLKKVVNPGVGAFCYFAAVALVFDFLLHLTFFVPVLSVDIRRMELEDSLEKAVLDQNKSTKSAKPERRTWSDALLKGKLPFSTRIAGSAVTICFVLVLNWHFFEQENRKMTILQLVAAFFYSGRKATPANDPSPSPPPMNQVRTPSAWLRLQDYETAKEVLAAVKPQAHTLVARVYDPVIVVLKDADRSGAAVHKRHILIIVKDLIMDHLVPIVLVVVLLIGVVTILMNYLLWNEIADDRSDLGESADPILAVRTLPRSHELDVVDIAGCRRGHIVSLGLDKSTTVSLYNAASDRRLRIHLHTASMNPHLWPIVATAIDDSGRWLGMCSDEGVCAIWDLEKGEYRYLARSLLNGRLPTLFTFAQLLPEETSTLRLLVCNNEAVLTEMDFQNRQVKTFQICKSPLICAALLPSAKSPLRIVTASRSGCMHVAAAMGAEWISDSLEALEPTMLPNGSLSRVKSITAIPSLDLFMAARGTEVDLIDPNSHGVVHTFQTGQIKGHSLRALHSPRRLCGHCSSPAVHSFTLAYTETESQNCMLHTFTLDDSHGSLICLRSNHSWETSRCQGFEAVTESLHWVESPGSWEATPAGSLIGIRKRLPASPAESEPAVSSVRDAHLPVANGALSMVRSPASSTSPRRTFQLSPRRRRRSRSRSRIDGFEARSPDLDAWEAWTMSGAGEIHTTALNPPYDNADPYSYEAVTEQLFVANPGPICQLGSRSIAAGYGNSVKVVSLGNERFDEVVGGNDDPRYPTLRKRTRQDRKIQ